MASTTPGHVALNGREYVLQDETYQQQLQTPFNPRFSTGDPNYGDLSFFQYLVMQDWSGGEGQETFEATNRFSASDGVDVTVPGEIRLAPLVEFVKAIEGPEAEHVSDAVEDEEAWPQIIEWLGRAIIYNDKIEFDVGGVEFLEVFETDILQDQVVGRDTSGQAGVITNDTRAEILSISKTNGRPGDLVTISVRFSQIELDMRQFPGVVPTAYEDGLPPTDYGSGPRAYKVRFRIDFGGDAELTSDAFAHQDIEYFIQENQLEATGTQSNPVINLPNALKTLIRYRLDRSVIVDFTVRIPEKPAGIYKLWTSAGWPGAPIKMAFSIPWWSEPQSYDPNSNANVLFYIQSVDTILVERKNLYAPQLKAATVVGENLVGCRTIDDSGYLEVYQEQDGAIDRTLQIDLADISSTIENPTYFELIGYNGVVVAAFDNRIYSIDILTSGLTAAQRFTFIGTVPGTYVSAMAIWNQRVYIGSFDKSSFRSTITWTDLIGIQGSYDIDGKFWITAMSNFNGGLFYSGGTELGEGRVLAFPAQQTVALENPLFDSRIRALNAGRLLYAGRSHSTGLTVINERGASNYSAIDLGEESTNIVWDIEEVGANVYFLAGNGLYKTVPQKFMASGYIESSELGGNTPLIKKGWNSITIEARDLNGAHVIRVLATHALRPSGQWIVLGEMREIDGLEKEFVLPSDFQAQWLKWRIEITTTDPGSSPTIKRVLAKYVPNVLQKWQWVFSVRATEDLKMLDKQTEKRTAPEILTNLRDLKSLGSFEFRDIDEQVYNVILTDMKIVRPIVDKNRPESLVLVELLEA